MTVEEQFEKLISRLEVIFQKWLTDFEARPITTSIRLFIVLLVVKWFYKHFILETRALARRMQ